MLQQNLTVVIPTRNEERNIEKCLLAIGDWCLVIVIDSLSSDQTKQIAKSYGATVLEFDWDGLYPKKRNWFLDSPFVNTEWVCFVDADEIITPEFKDEVDAKIKNKEYDGYWLNYTINFENKALRFGLPQRKLALFKSCFRYQKSRILFGDDLDMEIHEQPVVSKSKVGSIKSKITHLDPNSHERFVIKHLKYAIWEAGNHSVAEDADYGESVSLRQRAKRRLLSNNLFPFLYFLYVYILRLGFLDGSAGLSYAINKLWYFNLVKGLIKNRVTDDR